MLIDHPDALLEGARSRLSNARHEASISRCTADPRLVLAAEERLELARAIFDAICSAAGAATT
jgi:hypothetical protein